MQSQTSVQPQTSIQPHGDFRQAFDISDAFGGAIDHVRRVPGVAFVGGFLTMCTESSSNNIDIPDFTQGTDDPLFLFTTIVTGIGLFIWLLQFFLAPLFEAGFIVVQRELVDFRNPEPSLLFSAKAYYTRLLAWNACWFVLLLALLLPLLGFVYFGASDWLEGTAPMASESMFDMLLPFLIALGVWCALAVPLLMFLWLSFCFTSRIVVCEDVSLMEAARMSWQLTNGRRLSLIPFALVGFLFRLAGSLLGLLLCCVGIVIVYPFAIAVREVAWTRAYLWYVHGDPSQRVEEMADVFR